MIILGTNLIINAKESKLNLKTILQSPTTTKYTFLVVKETLLKAATQHSSTRSPKTTGQNCRITLNYQKWIPIV